MLAGLLVGEDDVKKGTANGDGEDEENPRQAIDIGGRRIENIDRQSDIDEEDDAKESEQGLVANVSHEVKEANDGDDDGEELDEKNQKKQDFLPVTWAEPLHL